MKNELIDRILDFEENHLMDLFGLDLKSICLQIRMNENHLEFWKSQNPFFLNKKAKEEKSKNISYYENKLVLLKREFDQKIKDIEKLSK